MSSLKDKDSIINEQMKSYMKTIIKINNKNNDYKNNLFSGDTLECVNSTIRNDNFYMLDKYGLVIRKNSQDSKKTAFGWKYNEQHEPIDIHISDLLLQTNSPDIQKITLQQLKQQFPNVFKSPRGIVYKVYINEFPDYNINEM